jgi:hypothetical protein
MESGKRARIHLKGIRAGNLAQELAMGLYFVSNSGKSSNRQKIKFPVFRPEFANGASVPDTVPVTDRCSM